MTKVIIKVKSMCSFFGKPLKRIVEMELSHLLSVWLPYASVIAFVTSDEPLELLALKDLLIHFTPKWINTINFYQNANGYPAYFQQSEFINSAVFDLKGIISVRIEQPPDETFASRLQSEPSLNVVIVDDSKMFR